MKRSKAISAMAALSLAVLLAGCSESTSGDMPDATTTNETVDASASEATETATEPTEEPEAAPLPTSPCTKKWFGGGGAAMYNVEQNGTICTEFPADLIPIPSVDTEYSGSRTVYAPGYSDEYRSTPDGGVLIDSKLMRLGSDKAELPSIEDITAQLTQLGWQQITPCQDYVANTAAGKSLADKRQVAGFATKDGWDLYVDELSGNDGWDMLAYTVSDFGQAALYCAG